MRPSLDDGLANRCLNHSANSPCWRKTEESNPTLFLRTQFSRLVAGQPSCIIFHIGVEGRIRTDGFRVLQALPLDRSGTPTLFWHHLEDSNS